MEPTQKTTGQPGLAECKTIHCLERMAVVYPSGNTTAIIFDQLPDYDPKILNNQVMQAWKSRYPDQPEIEQCCIVTTPQDPCALARVTMLGGEFCGNATRSALWLLAAGKQRTGLIEVSGTNRPLIFRVRGEEVMLEMPTPREGKLVRQVKEGWLVQLDGIAQLVTTKGTEQTLRKLLQNLLSNNAYGLINQPAVGVSSYDQTTKRAAFCVWVKAVATIFDETACGSGTCAIGIATAWKSGRSSVLRVIQPSGEVIRTETAYAPGAVTISFIAGSVKVLYDGKFKLA